jgi:hypothetical protein
MLATADALPKKLIKDTLIVITYLTVQTVWRQLTGNFVGRSMVNNRAKT